MSCVRPAAIDAVLAGPQVLDEGVDVPAAELGIILAANRAGRQRIHGWDGCCA